MKAQHGEGSRRRHVGEMGARNLALFESELHSDVVALTAKTFAAGVGVAVIDDLDHEIGRVAVATRPACVRPALSGELFTDLLPGFQRHLCVLFCVCQLALAHELVNWCGLMIAQKNEHVNEERSFL